MEGCFKGQASAGSADAEARFRSDLGQLSACTAAAALLGSLPKAGWLPAHRSVNQRLPITPWLCQSRLSLGVGLDRIGKFAVTRPLGKADMTATRGGQDFALSGEPERRAETGVAGLRYHAYAAEPAGLHGCRIPAAALQEPTMTAEAAQVARFGQHCERVDRANAGNGP